MNIVKFSGLQIKYWYQYSVSLVLGFFNKNFKLETAATVKG